MNIFLMLFLYLVAGLIVLGLLGEFTLKMIAYDATVIALISQAWENKRRMILVITWLFWPIITSLIVVAWVILLILYGLLCLATARAPRPQKTK